MKVKRTDKKVVAMPDYYLIYVRWHDKAIETGDNRMLIEAYRYARLAEEFGLAIIEDDDTFDS